MAEHTLRRIPKMDLLLAHPILERAGRTLPRVALRQAARACLEELRTELKRHPSGCVPSLDTLAHQIEERAASARRPRLRRVINATGVVLHTNLGRAPLPEAAVLSAYDAARGYSNLEYDLAQGQRGSRHSHVEQVLCNLTGAEAALAVNNNAAALFLLLSALAAGKRVAVSRGELVEIGGGFRIPDIMARSGASLVEVGTTNKTRPGDYERAIVEQGAELLLKVHASNYEIVGFTEETPLTELSRLGQEYALPVLYDLGSGALASSYLPALPHGPTVEDALRSGADVVCFSGDKLLGGPQAGVVVGKRTYIETMKRDPIARALRIDKLSLAALEATLLLYDGGEAWKSIPTLTMLNAGAEELKSTAEALSARLSALSVGRFTTEVLPVCGQVGGGAMPNLELPSWAVALTPTDGDVEQLERRLRGWVTPVIARIAHGRLLLDVRTLTREDRDELAEALSYD